MDTTTILIAGDSHVRRALDPELIPHSQNVALDAEPYMVTFYKVRTLLRAMPKLRVLILGFGPHNIAAFNDGKFRDTAFAFEMVRRYYGIEPWFRLHGIAKAWSTVLGGEAKYLWTPNGHLLTDWLWALQHGTGRDDHPYLGSYVGGHEHTLTQSALSAVLERHFTPGPVGKVGSAVQESYLQATVQMAAARGISVVLVNTPTEQRYRDKVPLELQRRVANLCSQMSRDGMATCVDLTDFLRGDGCFLNFDHVDQAGARLVSNEMARTLGLPERGVQSGRGSTCAETAPAHLTGAQHFAPASGSRAQP